MDKRIEAQKNGQITYDSGKPCRRGHMALRYSSTGACIECLKTRNNVAQSLSKANKAKTNLARVQGLTPCSFMVTENHRQIVQKLCDVLQYGDLNTITNISSAVTTWYESTPTPRTLFREKLQELVPDMGAAAIMGMFKAGMLQNDAKYGVTFFVHNGIKYLWDDVERVLSGHKQGVSPAPLVNDKPVVIPASAQEPRLTYEEVAQIGPQEVLTGYDDMYGPFVTRGGHLFRHAEVMARQRAGFGNVEAHTIPATPRPAPVAHVAPPPPTVIAPPPPMQPFQVGNGAHPITVADLNYIEWDDGIVNWNELEGSGHIEELEEGGEVLYHKGYRYLIDSVEELFRGEREEAVDV